MVRPDQAPGKSADAPMLADARCQVGAMRSVSRIRSSDRGSADTTSTRTEGAATGSPSPTIAPASAAQAVSRITPTERPRFTSPISLWRADSRQPTIAATLRPTTAVEQTDSGSQPAVN